MQLNIIYEDNDILICFKPAGIATQTAKLSGQDIVSLIKNYLAKKNNIKNPYVGVIHRLDQPVSGLLVFAKNQKTAGVLSKQIQDGDANKDYIALCTGILEKKRGILVHYIMKDTAAKLANVLSEDEYKTVNKENSEVQNIGLKANIYKKAILSYEVIKEFEDCSLINVHLQTGRFHQVRAQFSYIGHPLLGDVKYGTKESKEVAMKRGIRTVALCANELVLEHPISKAKMRFVLPKEKIPREMRS